jgi:hypothetical protein
MRRRSSAKLENRDKPPDLSCKISKVKAPTVALASDVLSHQTAASDRVHPSDRNTCAHPQNKGVVSDTGVKPTVYDQLHSERPSWPSTRSFHSLIHWDRCSRRSYPGAAAQGHNFAVRGVLGAVEHTATAGGAILGHIPGAVVGHAAGKIAGKISEKALLASVEKRIVRLHSATTARPVPLQSLLRDVDPAVMARARENPRTAAWLT